MCKHKKIQVNSRPSRFRNFSDYDLHSLRIKSISTSVRQSDTGIMTHKDPSPTVTLVSWSPDRYRHLLIGFFFFNHSENPQVEHSHMVLCEVSRSICRLNEPARAFSDSRARNNGNYRFVNCFNKSWTVKHPLFGAEVAAVICPVYLTCS